MSTPADLAASRPRARGLNAVATDLRQRRSENVAMAQAAGMARGCRRRQGATRDRRQGGGGQIARKPARMASARTACSPTARRWLQNQRAPNEAMFGALRQRRNSPPLESSAMTEGKLFISASDALREIKYRLGSNRLGSKADSSVDDSPHTTPLRRAGRCRGPDRRSLDHVGR